MNGKDDVFMKQLLALALTLCLILTACGVRADTAAEDAAPSGGVSESAENPDGADAEIAPKADVPAPEAEAFRDLFLSCTGEQDSAGASLRSAIRAYELVQFAVDHQLGSVDAEELRAALLDGYTQMDEEARAEFNLNFAAYLTPLAEDAFTAWNSVKDTFADAGVEEEIQALVQTPGAFEDWNALRSYVFIMGNEMS